MNIFYLEEHPFDAAKVLTDSHILKMGIESAQLLCNVYWANGVDAPYKKTHFNHPSSIWVRQSFANFTWLKSHAFRILIEFRLRYGKPHKTMQVIRWITSNPPDPSWFMESGFTDPPKCMPDEYKEGTTIEAYRRYYLLDKVAKKGLNWKKSLYGPPIWAIDTDLSEVTLAEST